MRYATSAFSRFVVCSIFLLTPYGLLALTAAEQGPVSNSPSAAPSGLTVRPAAIKTDCSTEGYYLPDCLEYDRGDPATMLLFATEEEAQRAGFHKAENCP
jgi:hypothetical protein